MVYSKNLKKIISIVVIISFVFYTDIILYSQQGDDITKQFQRAKTEYNSGQYVNSKNRLERVIGTIKAKKLEVERKDILGKCYLLLGAIYEKEGETILAEENYRRAKEGCGIESIDGVDLDDLSIYKRVVKGEIDIDAQFQKATYEYNNGQYDNSKNSLEQTIGTIKKESLEFEKKGILGKCYLLLGAIYEKKGETILAEENYRRAGDVFGIQAIDGVDFEGLIIYQKIMREGTIVKPGKKPKKKFPVLIVVGVAAAVVVAVLILGKKKKKEYTLTVTRGEGVDGTPNSGTTTYEDGSTVNYSYSVQNGYKDLEVRLDGSAASDSGTITMDRNHTLIASATPINRYTLTVTKGEGVDGSPESGTYTYDEGSVVNYSYSLQSGYTNLVVTQDGSSVAASGTITMNSNHTLTASASIGPSITITSHKNGDTVSGRIDIEGTAQSTKGISRVELWVNDSFITSDSSATFSLRWNTKKVEDGTYTARIVAYDTDGVPGEAQISLKVENEVGPTVTITNPQDSSSITRGDVVNIEVTASSDMGIDRVVFYIDEAEMKIDSSAPYSYEWDTTGNLEGSHIIRVVAYDNSGKTAEAQITVTITPQSLRKGN